VGLVQQLLAQPAERHRALQHRDGLVDRVAQEQVRIASFGS
jgi:hypothetical protein